MLQHDRHFLKAKDVRNSATAGNDRRGLMSRIIHALAVLGLVLSAGSAYAASDTFDINVVIRQPITVNNTRALDFGTLNADSGSYSIDAQASSGFGQSAEFEIVGEAGLAADVTLPASTTVTNGGGDTITVNLTLEAPTYTFSGGTEYFYVGGSLDTTGAVPGTYTGQETLTLLYQ